MESLKPRVIPLYHEPGVCWLPPNCCHPVPAIGVPGTETTADNTEGVGVQMSQR